MGRRKKFIDKKNAVTFHLVHRSQKDPLQADEAAPKHVLLPAEKRREEQVKFGVYFDDDYDYLQHLRDVDEINDVGPVEETASNQPKPRPKRKAEEVFIKDESDDEEPTSKAKLVLPSTVFASGTETGVGMLNKAAPLRGPQPDWDPDIVAALDDDFDFNDSENILDDDFILKANMEVREDENVPFGGMLTEDENVPFGGRLTEGAAAEGSDEEWEDYDSDEAEFSDDDQLGSLDGPRSFDSEETKSRFTNYTVTSSVMRRNDGLTLLDDQFEKLFEQYDDEEIGALEHEDIDGNIQQNSELLTQMMDEFEAKQKIPTMKEAVQKAEGVVVRDSDSEDSEVELEKLVVRAPQEKWDCESILSTRSTLYNHPTKIVEPKKIKLNKQGIPAGVLKKKNDGLSLKDIEKEFNENRNIDRAATNRNKDETTEEKRERKQAVKAERRERRAEKKETKLAFKKEKIRQDKEMINLQSNLSGIKMT